MSWEEYVEYLVQRLLQKKEEESPPPAEPRLQWWFGSIPLAMQWWMGQWQRRRAAK